MDALYIK